jgi:hypothetical protein
LAASGWKRRLAHGELLGDSSEVRAVLHCLLSEIRIHA